MRPAVRHIVAAFGLACLPFLASASIGAAWAQQQPADDQQAAKQIALTDKQIENFLAAKPDIDAIRLLGNKAI